MEHRVWAPSRDGGRGLGLAPRHCEQVEALCREGKLQACSQVECRIRQETRVGEAGVPRWVSACISANKETGQLLQRIRGGRRLLRESPTISFIKMRSESI